MAGEAADLRDQAERAVQTGAGKLPHLEKIQKAFGSYDVTGIKAHTGEQARQATKGMGALAFAMGDHVVMGQDDLFTAAHEAAHVVQQRAGTVSLTDGVGQEGDSYEIAADDVAQEVVQGNSVQGMLDAMVGASGGDATATTTMMSMATAGIQMCLDKTLMDPSSPGATKAQRQQGEDQETLAKRAELRTPGAGGGSSILDAAKMATLLSGKPGSGGGDDAAEGPGGATAEAAVSGKPDTELCEDENDKKKTAEAKTTTDKPSTEDCPPAPDGGEKPKVEGPQPYTVEAGDSLSLIAMAFYGTAQLWKVIYTHNKGVVGNDPNLIQPGLKLEIPENPVKAQEKDPCAPKVELDPDPPVPPKPEPKPKPEPPKNRPPIDDLK